MAIHLEEGRNTGGDSGDPEEQPRSKAEASDFGPSVLSYRAKTVSPKDLIKRAEDNLDESEDQDLSDALALLREDKTSSAFSELAEEYSPRLESYFRSKLHDPELAQDLTQEVMARLFTRRDRYIPQGKLTGYVMTVARNILLDHVRSKSYKNRPLSLHKVHDDGSKQTSPEIEDLSYEPRTLASKSEEAKALSKIIQELPEGKRAVMHMAFVEELPYEEISKRLGIPVGTVKSRVHGAKKILKKLIERN